MNTDGKGKEKNQKANNLIDNFLFFSSVAPPVRPSVIVPARRGFSPLLFVRGIRGRLRCFRGHHFLACPSDRLYLGSQW
ncbi:MAG: hypothetical protein K2K55_06590, partial [Duncaniella sp.]|nr:hypothetical protein [Duncaniella sp.]